MLTKQDYWERHVGYSYWDIDSTRKCFEKLATEHYCKNVLKDEYLIISDPDMQRMGVDVLTPDKTIDIKCRISVHPSVGAPKQFRDLTKYWNDGQDLLFELYQRDRNGKKKMGWATKSSPSTYDKTLPKEHSIVFVFLYIGYPEQPDYKSIVELDYNDVRKLTNNYISNDYFRITALESGLIREMGSSSSKMPGINISVKTKLIDRLFDSSQRVSEAPRSLSLAEKVLG